MTLDDVSAALVDYPATPEGRALLARSVCALAVHARTSYVRIYADTTGFLATTMHALVEGSRSAAHVALVATHVQNVALAPGYRSERLLASAERLGLLALVELARVLLYLAAANDTTARSILAAAIETLGNAAASDACEHRGCPERAEESRIAEQAQCLGLLARLGAERRAS